VGWETVRRWLLLTGAVAALALLSGCARDRDPPAEGRGPAPSAFVLPSTTYAATAGADAQRDALARLRATVALLRRESTSGWQARQDDETGSASELSGGTWRAPAGTTPLDAVRLFLTHYGSALGIRDINDQLRFPASLGVDGGGHATFRSVQVHGGVPVDGGDVVVAVDRASTRPEIGFARARIFDVAAVPTSPTISPDTAVMTIQRSVGVRPQAPPALVVLARPPPPALAWEAVVATVPGADNPEGAVSTRPLSVPAHVFVDAVTGKVLDVRAERVAVLREGVAAGPGTVAQVQLPNPPGAAAEVEGTAIGGQHVRVGAERAADGSLFLIDSTEPGADRAAGRGVISVHDGKGLQSIGELPGPLARVAAQDASDVPDRDALTAAWAAKQVIDYYRVEHGRLSFDNNGSAVVNTVHLPVKVMECNAGFVTNIGQMVFSDACVHPRTGQRLNDSMVDVGVVAHEITHGVTNTFTPGLGETPQSGAVNEGISDYFGVVIQDRVLGQTSSALGAATCGSRPPNLVCPLSINGQSSVRDVDTGVTLDDYEFLINEPFGLADAQNFGAAIHDNSLIFTNAMWNIRKRFVSLEGGDANTSPGAKRFDRVVYRALTTYFSNSTDLLAAAEAVTRASQDVDGVTATERDAIRQQLVASKLCRGCLAVPAAGRAVAVSNNVKLRPSVTSSGVTYAEYLSGTSAVATVAPGQGAATSLSRRDGAAVHVVAGGDWEADVLEMPANEPNVLTLRNLRTRATEELSQAPATTVAPAISPASIAWIDIAPPAAIVRWRSTTGGRVEELRVPDVPAQLAVDGPRVAIQTRSGAVSIWNAQDGSRTELGTLPSVDVATLKEEEVGRWPGQLAISGTRVAVLAPVKTNDLDKWQVVVYDTANGTSLQVSGDAAPYGLAMDGDLLVWSHPVGPLGGRVQQLLRSRLRDTDIEAYSFKSKKYFRLVQRRGQQGFPSLRGRQLAWQDAAAGSNDIYTAKLPTGL
jgi:Zn-dependent metalloprotease